MNNYEKLYWLMRLEPISNFLLACAVISGVFIFLTTIGFWIVVEDSADEIIKKTKKMRIFAIIILVLSVTGITLVPTRNEMILIYAGGKTLDYAQSDTSLSKIPYQATALISQYMSKAISELKDDDKKQSEKKK